ncbi:hypothetical protein [Gemmatimonas sp.]|uniref:hypothetical protein n=1 Tax=Gemmatimonas sp. TaxID=1962908 RepID=UPI00286E3E2F|nr:hypothetical protein [Gemmatimonas sp.]
MMIGAGVLAIAALVAIAMKRESPNAASSAGASPTAASNVAAPAENRSIAVLPRANLSGDKADDFLGIG